MKLDFGCEGCGQLDPLLETADARALCLRCVETDPDHAGLDADAVVMLRAITALTTNQDPSLN